MVDVWWGLCEKSSGMYDFGPYVKLFERSLLRPHVCYPKDEMWSERLPVSGRKGG